MHKNVTKKRKDEKRRRMKSRINQTKRTGIERTLIVCSLMYDLIAILER